VECYVLAFRLRLPLPLPPHTVTACFFRPRALNAGRRHLSPARGPLSLPPSRLMRSRYRPVGFRAPPRLSRRLPVAPVPLCRRPVASNAVEFRSPRASAAVYLLRPFPSAAVCWPQRRRISFAPRLSPRLPVAPVPLCRRPVASNAVEVSFAPAPQPPFTCCARFPLPPSVRL